MRTGILLLMVLLAGCLTEEKDFALPESQYEGTFMRLAPDGEAPEKPVSLTLINGRYTGASDSLRYPAICEGTYSIEGRRITFTNECAWTADFDWTLILQGTYLIEEKPNETVFIQEIGENAFNIFRFSNP